MVPGRCASSGCRQADAREFMGRKNVGHAVPFGASHLPSWALTNPGSPERTYYSRQTCPPPLGASSSATVKEIEARPGAVWKRRSATRTGWIFMHPHDILWSVLRHEVP